MSNVGLVVLTDTDEMLGAVAPTRENYRINRRSGDQDLTGRFPMLASFALSGYCNHVLCMGRGRA
ncbi:MAG: hypothetical protein ABI972_22910 [Acidobacteriota bacterium]